MASGIAASAVCVRVCVAMMKETLFDEKILGM